MDDGSVYVKPDPRLPSYEGSGLKYDEKNKGNTMPGLPSYEGSGLKFT